MDARGLLGRAAGRWEVEVATASEGSMRAHDEEPAGRDLTRRPPAARKDTAAHDTSAEPAALLRGARLDPATVLRLQRSSGNASVAALVEGQSALQRAESSLPLGKDEEHSPVLDVVGRGGGRPLEPELRSDMEQRLGHDFDDVRVHADGQAGESARSVGAHAYTVGNEVVFQPSTWAPETVDGRRMLAHELTHVVQQRSGPVDGTPTDGGVSVSHPSDRFEQEATRLSEHAVPGPAPAGVQRQAEADQDEEAEAVQGAFVQRQAEDETEEEAEPVQGAFVQRQAEDEEAEEPTG